MPSRIKSPKQQNTGSSLPYSLEYKMTFKTITIDWVSSACFFFIQTFWNLEPNQNEIKFAKLYLIWTDQPFKLNQISQKAEGLV